MKVKVLVIVLLLCFRSAHGQTVADIENTHGKPQRVYSVSEHIWMTAEYAIDGQVCRMRLYPKRVDGITNYVRAVLQYNELRDLLNSLVPPDKRGLKAKLNFGATATGGPATWTTYAYERVTFTFTSSFLPSRFVESTPLRRGEYSFPLLGRNSNREREALTASNDDFLPSQSSSTEIVTLVWNDRNCPH